MLGLVAGSHNRNELVIIPNHHPLIPPETRSTSSSSCCCGICGDELGLTEEGEQFVACHECAFPVCRTCYDYERREGSQVCPQCKTRFKRLRGCARVDGDEEEEEEDTDDLDNELAFSTTTHDHHQHHIIPLLARADSLDDDQRGLVPAATASTTSPSSLQHLSGFTLASSSILSLLVQPRPLDPSKDLAAYGYGSVAWKERMELWKHKRETNASEDPDSSDSSDAPLRDEARQPLSRKLPIRASQINPYRMLILIRLVVLIFFFHYRLTHPVKDAYALWLVSVVCEIWFVLTWMLDQFPKWLPIQRETHLDRLSLRYDKASQPSQLAPVEIFVATFDPLKEPPLLTANTVLSVLAVDYPVDKVSCYVSDDGASMLTFEALSETSDFAKKWVPFCKNFGIEPRAPEWYFAKKVDYRAHPSFVRDRRAMKREYEEFKVRINALVATAQKVPEDGWTMQDGTPWPGNNVHDHPGMTQVLGQCGGQDSDEHKLPRLVYVSRENRPGFNNHDKAGAMNALVRVSAVLTNAPYLLNLDCDHYINNSKALREAMCFLMDPSLGKKVCYVQFPLRYDGIDRHDRYANRNTVFFDVNMKGFDGIQGPMYVGTGCVFRRQALYGYDAPKKKKRPTRTCSCWPRWWSGCCCLGRKKEKANKFKPLLNLEGEEEDTEGPESSEGGSLAAAASEHKLDKKFGQSSVLVSSTLQEGGGKQKNASVASLLKEAIHVIGCAYEDKTEWGKEVGWMYGSVREDILTGFKMHCHGWRSVYCMPQRAAFKGSAPINLSDRLNQVLGRALGSIEIFLSRHSPLWYGYGGGLKWLERLGYINATVYPWTSIPLLTYCTLPAVCLLTGKFIVPEVSNAASMWFVSLFICIVATGVLEMKWSGVGIEEWWRNEQFWVIGGVSADLFGVFQGILKVLAGIDINSAVTSKGGGGGGRHRDELYAFKWTMLLIPPTTLLVVNIVGVAVGISKAIYNGYESWGPLFGKLFMAFWVIIHLYPFLKGLLGRQNRTPTIVLVWSILLASVFSLLWVRMDSFLANSDDGAFLEECGLDCT